MKRVIKLKRIHWLEINGIKKKFMSGDLAEVSEEEAKRLIADGIALPGPQHGAVLSHRFEKEE